MLVLSYVHHHFNADQCHTSIHAEVGPSSWTTLCEVSLGKCTAHVPWCPKDWQGFPSLCFRRNRRETQWRSSFPRPCSAEDSWTNLCSPMDTEEYNSL